jgi:hypothetical protein
MATYNTTSGFPDLVGSMVVTNGIVQSYTSNDPNLGAGTIVPPNNAPVTRFSVRFGSGTGPGNRAYNISSSANPSGNGYSGTANNNSPVAAQEDWSATASTAAPMEESTADADDASAVDGVAKKAAI